MQLQSVTDQSFTAKDSWIVAYLLTQYQLHGLFNTGRMIMLGVAGKEGRESAFFLKEPVKSAKRYGRILTE